MSDIEPTYYADYRAEHQAARAEGWHRYPMPGQWVGGEWREYTRAEAEAAG